MSVSVSVDLNLYICRWCGCAYGVPAKIAETKFNEIPCPNGHTWVNSSPINDRLKDAINAKLERGAEIYKLNRKVKRLERTITELKINGPATKR